MADASVQADDNLEQINSWRASAPHDHQVAVSPKLPNEPHTSQGCERLGRAVGDSRCLATQQAALNPDVAPFVPRSYVVTRDGIGPSATEGTGVNSNSSFVLSEKQSITRTNELIYSGALRIASISTQSNSICVGYIESRTVRFLLDSGAEVTVIGEEILATLPKSLRTVFQDRSSTLKVANGDSVVVYGPVLCNISVLERTVLEAVYVMPNTEEAILGTPALTALGLCITLAEVEVLKSGSNPAVRRLQMPKVYRVTADRNCTVPPLSEAIVTGRMQGKPLGSLFAIEPKNSLQQNSLLVARTVAGHYQGRTPVRIFNPSYSELVIKLGEHIADAEAAQVAEEKIVEESTESDLPEHIKVLFGETCTRKKLSEAAQCELRSLLLKHGSLFAKDDND